MNLKINYAFEKKKVWECENAVCLLTIFPFCVVSSLEIMHELC